MVDEVARVHIRQRDQRAEREQHHRLDVRVVAERDLTRDGDRNRRAAGRARSSRRTRGSSRRPPDRRCAPRAGAAAAAQACASSLIRPGRSSARSAFASSKRHCRRSGFADRICEHAHLDCRHAGQRRRPQYGITLHRLDLAAGRAADAGRGPDRLGACSGQGATRGLEQRGVGRRVQLDPARVVGVAVDRLGADDRLGLVERPSARDPDVQDRLEPLHGLQFSGGARRRLDRADSADERRASPGAPKLVLGRGDDENHARTVSA